MGPGSVEQLQAALQRVRDMSANQNGTRRPRSNPLESAGSLLDLGLAEFDVLARNRIVFLLYELVGHGTRILLGDVIEAGIRRGNELDLDGDRFGHVQDLKYLESGAGQSGGAFAAQPTY